MVRGQLGTALTRTVPISLFMPGSLLHELLVGYKAAPSRLVREERRAQLSRLLGEFLSLHLRCLVAPVLGQHGDSLVVPVPSSSPPRPSWGGEHPLIGLVASAIATEPGLALAPVLARGTEPLGHLRASRRGFRLVAPVADQRVLVVDDTYTSGARSQSAAVAAGRWRCSCARDRSDRSPHPSWSQQRYRRAVGVPARGAFRSPSLCRAVPALAGGHGPRAT